MALPIPAVKGGGVEWLIQTIIDENESNGDLKITVLGIDDEEARNVAQKYKNTEFVFIKRDKIFYKYYGYIKKIFGKTEYFMPYIAFLRKYFKKNKYDKIIVENNINLFKALKKASGELIFHLHNDTVNKDCVLPEEYRSIDRVFCVSDFIRSQVLSTDCFDEEQVKVLHNCNCMQGDTVAADADDFRAKMGIAKDDVVFLYSGRLIREKGVLELVLAFSRIDTRASVKLVIVGGINYSNDKEDSYFKKLKSVATPNVIFTGYVDYKEMKNYYGIADIIVVPTLYFEDAAPLVVIEAMSEGIPIIASDSGGIWDFVNERCGIKIKRNENFIKELADKMFYLASSRETMQDMKQSALQSSKEYTKEKYFSNFVELINRK